MTTTQRPIKLLLILLMLIVLASCGTVLRTEFRKGRLLKEEPTGRMVELERTPVITLETPTVVSVSEEVRSGQEYRERFEKVRVEEKELFGSTAEHRKVMRNEYLEGTASRNEAVSKQTVTFGSVSVTVNDVRRDDIPIGTNGTAALVLERYFDTFPEGKDIKVEFQYKTAKASTVIPFAEAKRNALAMLPLYRKRGAATRSALDFITAFKISNDLADLTEARYRARTDEARAEIGRLYDRYSDAENAVRREKYGRFVNENCKGTVLDLKEFALHGNARADKGKCVTLYLVKNSAKPIKSGLFQMSDKVFYIEFPAAYKGTVAEGLARIEGVHRYATEGGKASTAPRLRYLPDTP